MKIRLLYVPEEHDTLPTIVKGMLAWEDKWNVYADKSIQGIVEGALGELGSHYCDESDQGVVMLVKRLKRTDYDYGKYVNELLRDLQPTIIRAGDIESVTKPQFERSKQIFVGKES